ncbi:hypothetical protein PSR30_12425 [Pectobacterium carotovorum subsp. carotovorum]|uniref:hypothetical protein n=1 Tax=Pectobacterium TaxID=122277 RepID=UPI00057E9AF7|nr:MULTISPECIES: hypothetical protein [Pectobacterium]KHS89439.1 hypothetical protein RC83_06005 [Pectobacterium brasiliense]KHT39690.1 hypothetical protein RD02_15850 [Pectobacterium brasiliense]MDC9818205.1 hypothetical protein [Pectobacterium polonicum]POE22994.1 hypothetical protein BV923_07015 [Pectobacterium odoriferum]WDF97240.1 hypothetical protein PSR30_12425 [Pectobacterium carotovorum subsp. carotovorum]
MSNGAQSFSSQLLISIISIFLGSFLFAGVLESYKKDQGLQDELIKNYYRPMRELQSSCSSSHNDLFLKYGELSGSYQIMYNEIVHMSVTPDYKLGRDYESIPISIIKANNELEKRIEDLEATIKKCKSDLFLKYEELALVTGSYPKFMRLAKKYTSEINFIYSERQKETKRNTKNIDPNQLMPLIRKFISIDLSDDKNRSMLISEMKEIFKLTTQHSLIMAEYEQSIFEKDNEFFQGLHDLYAMEISEKYSGGFINWVF